MSLYDDIDLDSKELSAQKSDVSGWSSGYKLLQGSKKSTGSTLQPRKRGSTALAPVVDLKRQGGSGSSTSISGAGGLVGYSASDSAVGPPSAAGGEIRFNHITGKLEAGPLPASHSYLGVALYPEDSVFAGLTHEYEPKFPNDYQDFSKRLRNYRDKEREEERKRDAEERQRRKDDIRKARLEKIAASFQPPPALYEEKEEEIKKEVVHEAAPETVRQTESTKRLALYDSSDSEDEQDIKKEPTTAPTAAPPAMFAPPPALMEESKPMTPPPPVFSEPPPTSSSEFSIVGKGGSVASKIMAKMGYKHGAGLGRDEQGMSMALQVEKTSRRGGKILSEKDMAIKEAAHTGPVVKADTGITNMELLRNPTKVVLLTNMVGPGDVDGDLEPETAEECTKYGKVASCHIHEMPNVPEMLAVRIFVEFENISSAIKAAIDLNGRFFGGRVVRASFYTHDKFLSGVYTDEPL